MYNTDFNKHLALHGIQKKRKNNNVYMTQSLFDLNTRADWYLMANNVLCFVHTIQVNCNTDFRFAIKTPAGILPPPQLSHDFNSVKSCRTQNSPENM